jgi:anaerobic selenocysteine-containing dehydrogenase
MEMRYQKYLKGGFKTPSRKVEIYSLDFHKHGYDPLPGWKAPEEVFSRETVARYPFTLTSSKTIAYCHGQHRSIPTLRQQVPEPFAEISRQDADSLGIREGDPVRVETEISAITVKATINDRIPGKMVRVMHGWWQGCPELGKPAYDPFTDKGANVNLIIANNIIDPITGSVPHRSYPCRVTRASDLQARE